MPPEPAPTEPSAKPSAPGAIRRLLPLLLVAAALGAFFALGGPRYVSLDYLRENRAMLAAFVEENRLLAPLAFMALYAALVAISFPGATFLTIASGFLFGPVLGPAYAVLGATAGATAIFLMARTGLGETLRARAGGFIRPMEEGFSKNAWSYLLFLRLIPAFPFWVVNLVPAFLGVRLSTFVLATAIGIVPGAAVYANIGNGLGLVFERGEEVSLSILGRPELILPIVGLAVLALVPVLYRRFAKRSAD